MLEDNLKKKIFERWEIISNTCIESHLYLVSSYPTEKCKKAFYPKIDQLAIYKRATILNQFNHF